LDAVLTGRDAQGIVDSAYTVVRLPIIAFDVQFRLLAYAFDRPCYYAAWEEIAVGQGTAQFMEYLPNQERIFRHGRSLLFDNKEIVEVACAVTVAGKLVGYVGMIIEDAGIQAVHQANDLLAAVLSYYYEYSATEQAIHAKEPGEAELLAVLFADVPPQAAVAAFAHMCEPAYVFAVVESDKQSIADLQFIRSTYCKELNQIMGCVGDNGQLRMLYWNQRSEDLRWITEALRNIGNAMSMSCGVSDTFSSLTEIRTYRTQALEALCAGLRFSHDQRVFLFTECLHEIICAAALDRLGRSALVPAEITALAAADAAEHSGYLETLAAFLRNHGGTTKTAKDLGIHNNTLQHRLRKIEDRTGVVLKDPRTLFRLQVGLAMLQLLRADKTGR